MRMFREKLWFTTLLVVMLLILLSVPALAKDYDGHWAAGNIEKAYERNWVDNGDNFRPDDKITRGEFVDMLWRALGSHAPDADCPFSDVPEDAFYRQAATRLHEDGIVMGYGGNTFGPQDSLTREQGFTLLSRAFKLAMVKPDAYKNFADWNEVSAWALEPLSAMTELGYVEGVGNNNCAPQKALTRAEMVTLLLRVADGSTKELAQEAVPLANITNIPAASSGGTSGGGGGGGGGTTSTAPGAPQNFTATSGNGEVSLSWSAPASNGGSAILRYELSWDNGAHWENIGNVTHYTKSGLSNGVSYTFVVRAVNSVGAGISVPSTVTPAAPAPPAGTNDPIKISTAQELQNINKGLDKHYILVADIIITSSWTPIGDSRQNDFEGVLDGGGHTISFRADESTAAFDMLFGYIGENGSVKNLQLKNVDFSASETEITIPVHNVASLAYMNFGVITGCNAGGTVIAESGGPSGGLVAVNNGTITNCSFSGAVNGLGNTGGLVGDNWGSITGCYSRSLIDGSGDVGGLAGESSGDIIDCYFSGTVTASANSLLGGLVGENYSRIINCYAEGIVRALPTEDFWITENVVIAGGLVGENKGSIINCYATSEVRAIRFSGESYVGGLVGRNGYEAGGPGGSIVNCYAAGDTEFSGDSGVVGGLVGYNQNYIGNCMALNARVNGGDDNIGRIFGGNDGGSTKNNYANSAMKVTGKNVNGTLTDKNGMDMGWETFNFESWWADSFWTSVWGGNDTAPWQWGGDDYSLPILYWQEAPSAPAPQITGVVTQIPLIVQWAEPEKQAQYQKITIFDREGEEVTYKFAPDFINGYNALLNANSGMDGSLDRPYPYFSEDGNDISIHWDECKNIWAGETIKELAAGDIVELVTDENDQVIGIANYAAFQTEGLTANIYANSSKMRITINNGPSVGPIGTYLLNKHAAVFNVIPDADGKYRDVKIMTAASVLAGDSIAYKVVPFNLRYGHDLSVLYIIGGMDKYNFGVLSGQSDGASPSYTINGAEWAGDGSQATTIPAVIAYTVSNGKASIEYYLTEGTGAEARCVPKIAGRTIPDFVQAVSLRNLSALTGTVDASASSTGYLKIGETIIYAHNAFVYDMVKGKSCEPRDLNGRYVLAVYDKDDDALLVAALNFGEPAPQGAAVITVAATAGGTAWHNGEQGDSFTIGDTVTLTALADEEYVFIAWQDENGVIVSKEAEYSFAVKSDIALTAVFAAKEPD